jgi:hypothetical protein
MVQAVGVTCCSPFLEYISGRILPSCQRHDQPRSNTRAWLHSTLLEAHSVDVSSLCWGA